MRPVSEWTLDDLTRLHTDEVPESLTLDYKQSETLKRTDGGKRELAKDVSSFANSAGGRIVIGIIEEDNKPTGLDGGVDENEWSRESIEQIIDSNVTPRIIGLLIQPIPLGNGRCYYVIDIPQAIQNAPHQVRSNRKYHKRLNFTSTEMEDYEIRDAMRRSSAPDVCAILELLDQGEDDEDSRFAVIRISLRNSSAQYTEHGLIRWFYDKRIESQSLRGLGFSQDATANVVFEGESIDLLSVRAMIHPTNHMPLYKEETPMVGVMRLKIPSHLEKVVIYGHFTCPGCARWTQGVLELKGEKFFLSTEDVSKIS